MLNFKFELGATFYDMAFPALKFTITKRLHDVDNKVNIYEVSTSDRRVVNISEQTLAYSWYKFESTK